MASISSLMGSSSSSSSIYGSRNSNIISGLASGLDTESMIEGMVQSYKQKIQSLQQDRTKLQWQQSGYQSISDKLVEFSRKYTSYTSTTNLLSNSFFNNAVITSTKGKYADLVTASGKSTSDVVLNGVRQLATAARYQTSAGLGTSGSAAVGGHVDLSKPMVLSQMTGTLSLSYNGNEDITLSFNETDDLFTEDGKLDMEKFKTALEEKLSEQKLTDKSGNKVSASELINVGVGSDGQVTLSTKGNAISGASIQVSGASGNFAKKVTDLDDVTDKSGTFHMNVTDTVADISATKAEYLSGKTFSVTLNGQTKKVTLGEIERQNKQQGGQETWSEATARTMQEALDDAFGKNSDGTSKIEVELIKNPNSFSFNVGTGNTLSISSVESGVGEVLFGEGNDTLTSYLDTSKTLGNLGTLTVDKSDSTKATLKLNNVEVEGTAIFVKEKDRVQHKEEDGTIYYTDREGNKLDSEGYQVNSDGERLYEFKLTINGKSVGSFTQDTALETVTNSINSNAEAGVNVSYSKLTNEFVFTAKSTGAAEKIEMGDGLAKALFGDSSKYEKGQDAIFIATVNGGEPQTFTRSSNSVDLDGLKVTLDDTFNVDETTGKLIDENEKVTFSTKTDTDTLVEAIKQMVNDYNTMVTEVKKAYSDMPLQKSNGSRYEPLTSDDEEGMTESEIKAYEEKAKTGILFMDRDLSSLYSELRSAVTPSGTDGSYLRSIGINTSYSDGLTTISLDESALRQALETDLDGVRNAFTKSKESGSATDGLMTTIQKVTDKYAATTGATKGILIKKAGSQYSPTAALDNTMLDKMEDIDEQIEKWQDKMSDKVDYYTNKFTQLEMLINQMNSQSSALAGLMGNG